MIAPTRFDDDPRLSPDCDAGKHAACTGGAWDMSADLPAPCTCECHEPDGAA